MDFFVEQTIHAAPEDVAKVMFDPAREPEWVDKASKAELLTTGPLRIGSRVRHEAGVHGWKLSFITEVKEFEPDRKLVMDVANGAENGQIIYQVAPTAGGSIASIHVHDEGMARMPHSVWARKDQAKDNLHKLAQAVTHPITSSQ